MQNAEAAVVSKVASAAAKKVAKVPIKELTKDIAFDMAAQAIGQQFNEKLTFKFEEGYEGYCMTEIKPDGSCGRVVQVKKNLTVHELDRIDKQVETEMDKAITGGKGFPKWQKFLDWFLPIWLVSAGVTAITYAFDSDVKSLFNEIGYNTLVSLGLIKPLHSPVEFTPIKHDSPEYDIPFKPGDNLPPSILPLDVSFVDLIMKTQVFYFNERNSGWTDWFSYYVTLDGVSYEMMKLKSGEILFNYEMYGDIRNIAVKVNGNVIKSGKPGEVYNSLQGLAFQSQLDTNWYNRLSTVNVRTPYKVGSSYYTDVLVTTKDGNILEFQAEHEKYPQGNLTRFQTYYYDSDRVSDVSSKVITNQIPNKLILVPAFEEVQEEIPEVVTKYEKDKNIAIVPPAAVPLREVGTGETVIRNPSKTPGGENTYQKPDGTIVPEDNIEVGDPVVTPSKPGQTDPGGKPIPEGTPVVTPTPTPSVPTPAPIPVVPTPTPTNPADPDAPTVPPTDPPGTGEPFPPEETCDAKLNFPRYIPFMNTLSNAFPFSIPWDIQRALNAAFGEIGSERPGFDYTFNFNGQEKTWRIEVPKFFDSWKPFTDGLLLLVFDVGIMFGIYRFMKGGGS